MIEYLFFLHAISAGIGAGFSIAILVSFISFFQDMKIDKYEVKTLKVLQGILRSFMWILLVLTIFSVYFTTTGYSDYLPSIYFYIGQLVLIAILFINAHCMKMHYLKKVKLVPIQVAAWYTQSASFIAIGTKIDGNVIIPFIFVVVFALVYFSLIKMLPIEAQKI